MLCQRRPLNNPYNWMTRRNRKGGLRALRAWKRRTRRVHPVILEIVTYIEFWSLPAKFKPKCIVYPGDYGVNTPWAFESAFASIHENLLPERRRRDASRSPLWSFPLCPSPLDVYSQDSCFIQVTILIAININWYRLRKWRLTTKQFTLERFMDTLPSAISPFNTCSSTFVR